jgi:hypothetical protein
LVNISESRWDSSNPLDGHGVVFGEMPSLQSRITLQCKKRRELAIAISTEAYVHPAPD